MTKTIVASLLAFSLICAIHPRNALADPDTICTGGDGCQGYNTGQETLDAIVVIAKANPDNLNISFVNWFASYGIYQATVTFNDDGTVAGRITGSDGSVVRANTTHFYVYDSRGLLLQTYPQQTGSGFKPCGGCGVR